MIRSRTTPGEPLVCRNSALTSGRASNRVGGVIIEAAPAHPGRCVLPTDADDKGMPPRLLGGVEHLDGARAGCDHGPVGEANPLPLVLAQKAVPRGPILCLIFAPVRVYLLSNFRG